MRTFYFEESQTCSSLDRRDILEVEFNSRAFVTQKEALCLAKYAQQAVGDVVEVGTFRGGGTEILRQYAPGHMPVWSIDSYEGIEAHNPVHIYYGFLAEYAGVFLIVGDSAQVGAHWGKDIGLLFIDADHTYEVVKKDFESWTSWVVEDGIVVMHDAVGVETVFSSLSGHEVQASPGVAKLLEEVVRTGLWEIVETVDTTAVLKRTGV